MHSQRKYTKEQKWIWLCYGLILLAVSFPLFSENLGNRVALQPWLGRIEEIAEAMGAGNFLLFPSLATVKLYGGNVQALNSNLWLFIPAVLRVFGLSTGMAWRGYVLILQMGSILTSRVLFKSLFTEEKTVCFAAALYMLSPYCNWLYYQKMDLGNCVTWLLLPLVIWSLRILVTKERDWKSMLVGAAAFAGIGYGDNFTALMIVGLFFGAIIWFRKPFLLGGLVFGILLWLPGSWRYLQYVLQGEMQEWNFPIQSISVNGYYIGQFLTSYAYKEDLPGLGLGLIGSLLVLFWLQALGENHSWKKAYGFWGVFAIVMLVCSLAIFPWDVARRVALPLFRMIPLWENQTIFFGIACSMLVILGTCGVDSLKYQKLTFIRIGFPLMLFLATLGVGIYLNWQCCIL